MSGQCPFSLQLRLDVSVERESCQFDQKQKFVKPDRDFKEFGFSLLAGSAPRKLFVWRPLHENTSKLQSKELLKVACVLVL